jgi:hypothetical protein
MYVTYVPTPCVPVSGFRLLRTQHGVEAALSNCEEECKGVRGHTQASGRWTSRQAPMEYRQGTGSEKEGQMLCNLVSTQLQQAPLVDGGGSAQKHLVSTCASCAEPPVLYALRFCNYRSGAH